MRKLAAAAQEERRRQVIGLREAGLTYGAIAAQVGLTQTGVFDICKRFAEHGEAGLKSGLRGVVARISWLVPLAGQDRRTAAVLIRDCHHAFQGQCRAPSPHPEAEAQGDELDGV